MTTRYFFFVLLAVGLAGSAWAAPFTGTFTKITSTDDLTTGYYVIVGSESASNSDYAMGSTVKSGHINGVYLEEITDGTTITNPDNAIVYLITSVGPNTYTFQTMLVPETDLYVYRVNNTSGGGLKIDPTYASYITCGGYDSESPIGFEFTFDGEGNNNKLQFNSSVGALYFANYSGYYTTTSTPVRLFKLEENQDPGSATEVENTEMEMQAKKIVRDGQILILRGEHTYTIQGQEIIVP